jgi:hypothetical protein
MSEVAMAEETPRPEAELLVEAVDSLPPEDRKRVLAWLLDASPRSPGALLRMQALRSGLTGALPELLPLESEGLLARYAPLRGDHQTVPVRLPTEQYHRLREWCQDKGFSMATVIRGLIGRFLDEQPPPAAPGA